MRAHLVALLLVFLACVWQGRAPSGPSEPVADAEKVEAWLVFSKSHDFRISSALHLRERHYVLSTTACQGYHELELGIQEMRPHGILLTSYWTGEARLINLDSWRQSAHGGPPGPRYHRWEPPVWSETTEATRAPSIAGLQPGDTSDRERFFALDHEFESENGRIRMVSGIHMHVAGRHLWKGIGRAEVLQLLGPPSDSFEIEGVDLSYLKWERERFVILVAVGPGGEVEKFGLR